MFLHPYQESEGYKTSSRIQRLWIDLSIAFNHCYRRELEKDENGEVDQPPFAPIRSGPKAASKPSR